MGGGGEGGTLSSTLHFIVTVGVDNLGWRGEEESLASHQQELFISNQSFVGIIGSCDSC